LYSNACGKLNFDPESPDFTTDSVCRIASMSKLVTAISAMQLVEKKLIGLDEDVAKYVPELANKDILKGFEDDSTPILARQTKQMSLRCVSSTGLNLCCTLTPHRTLLTHSSGFAYDNFDPNILKWSASVGRTVDSGSMTKEGYTFPLIFEPGEGWMYGVGLDWAGHVVSVLSHCTLDEYIQKNICQVLGMSSTTFAISERPDLASRRARLAFRAAPRGPLAPDENPMPEPPAMYSGGAGLFSTVKDYTKLLSVLMEEDGSILTKESIRELFKPQFDAQMAQQLQFFFDGALHEVACPEYPRGTPVNHALGGAVNLEDIPGTRRKGSMMWSGSTNGHWVSLPS
jgi:CubicO group peptidase (beta-lactamase class C family)